MLIAIPQRGEQGGCTGCQRRAMGVGRSGENFLVEYILEGQPLVIWPGQS